jgi:UDP-N-acetylmuramyl pentapeptide phosphotransferase/UDP-N-acetylglucosamine-1-phosphate transferase
VALTAAPSLQATQRWTLALTAGVFGLVGLLEDVFGISALLRLGVQFAAGAFAGVLLLDDVTGSTLWRLVFGAAVVFWLVAFVNAYNFMDGINGISVAQAVGAGGTWLLVGTYADSPALAVGGAIVAAAALGFAPYNVPQARMFLGDVGSYFIGAWLAAVAVLGLRDGVPWEAVLAPLALYVADTGTTLLRRAFRGERWYQPHRDHAYQRLADAGWSHVQRSAFVAACICACAALGAVSLGDSLPARVAADVAIAGVIGAYLLLPAWLAPPTPPVQCGGPVARGSSRTSRRWR